MQRYYAHVIARYRSAQPIDLEAECAAARERVDSRPFEPCETPAGPQREAQRRRRARGGVAHGCATSASQARSAGVTAVTTRRLARLAELDRAARFSAR